MKFETSSKKLAVTVNGNAWMASGALAALALVTACTGGGSPAPSESRSRSPLSEPAVSTASGTPTPSPVSPGNPLTPAGESATLPGVPPDPERTKSAWRDGVTLYNKGEYRGATDALRLASMGRDQDAYTHSLLGLALWKSGQAKSAEEALVRSASLNPDAIKTWINLARVRMDLKDPRGALEATDEGLRIDPSSPDTLHQRWRALAALGSTDASLEALKQALGADPDNGYFANSLGNILIRAGRPAEAIPYLERAREKLPRVSYVRNNLGVAYERTGQLEKAVEEYRASVEAGDSDGKASASLARLEPLARTIVAKEPEPIAPGTPPLAQALDGDGTGSTRSSPHE